MEQSKHNKEGSGITTYYKALGPGIVTGAADDDPSGIATYSQAGAQGGYQFLWVSFFTLPFMIIIQTMCARIGIVTGKGLATNMRRVIPKPLVYICISLLFITNTFNIGADLGAMASASSLLLPSVPPAIFIIFFALLSLNLQIFIPYKKYTKYLTWLTFVLFFYIIVAFSLDLPWKEILHSLIVPHIAFTKDNILLLTALLGTTISPYLFFWQTSQEVEEKLEITSHSTISTIKASLRNMHVDTFVGMAISNIVMFFIIVVCAATLHTHGITNINTATDAAMALEPFAGPFAYLLFTLGIVGTGLLALPILAGSTSYAFSETFNWNEGLSKKWNEAQAFYAIITLSIVIGLLLLLLNISPIKMLLYAAILNGLVAPVVLFCIIRIASDKNIMGNWKSHPFILTLSWIIAFLMTVSAIATLIFIF